jgi:hypothetical protein
VDKCSDGSRIDTIICLVIGIGLFVAFNARVGAVRDPSAPGDEGPTQFGPGWRLLW